MRSNLRIWFLLGLLCVSAGCDQGASSELQAWAETRIERARELVAEQSPALGNGPESASGDGSDGRRQEDLAETETPSFYRYTDDSGSVRFVTSLSQVPARFRSKARAAGGGSVTRTATTTPGARKPYVYRPGPGRGASGDVVVYTAPWCGWCRKTTAWLDSESVSYENKDIESNPRYREELLQKTGRTSIPYVEIGNSHISGYSPDRMSQLLRDS